MDINTPPKIVMTKPKNYAIDVMTTIDAITIGFSTDLDPAHIGDNVRLQAREGAPIPITLKYEYRTITVKPKQILSPNTTYQIMIFGDGNLTDKGPVGIRSALGVAMQGNALINFTTMKSDAMTPPIGFYPGDKAIVNSVPAFNWERGQGNVVLGNTVEETARSYEIEISKSNTMNPIHWSSRVDAPPVFPGVPFEDGVYYWRVRGIDKLMHVSDWTPIYVFNLDTQQESPLTPEDTLPPEMDYDKLNPIDDGYVEFIDYFPKENFSNVKENLKTIYFTILGEVKAEDISIEMLGESVMGDSTDHGLVTGTIEVLPQGNGTTIIAYTPDVLQNASN